MLGKQLVALIQKQYLSNWKYIGSFLAGIYLLKINNRYTRPRCEICSKLTKKIPEQRQWRRSDIFIVNFEHISHLALVFLLLILNMKMSAVLLGAI